MRNLISAISILALCLNLSAGNIFSVRGGKTFLNDKEILVKGLRCSNSLLSDETTDALINHLDLYRSYGVNTISVFFMGSRFGDIKGYREDASLNPVYRERMARIIRACDRRDMLVLVGCLYWGGSNAKWESWEQKDAENAVANTVKWLSKNDFRNVFIDPDNEGMAHRGAGFDITGMIAAGKKTDPSIMIGFNAKGTPPLNSDIALHFSDKLPGMPYIQSEGTMTDYWGSYSKEEGLYEYINVGVYTEGKKAEQIKDTKLHLDRGDGYIFASTWLQNVPPNYRLGGDGSHCDPGIKWWLDFIGEHYPGDGFDLIRERVVSELLKSAVDDDRVETIINRMNEDGSFQDINYEDLSRTAGFPQREHTYNLVYLARAYKIKTSVYYGSEGLKEVIIRGLKYWVDNDFFGDNWHNNQISTPTNLVNLMLLTGEELPGDLVDKAQPIIGRANMNASGARPSGDRIVIAGILAKNLLFKGDKEEFEKIIELIQGEMKFSTGKRGMQHDYSFHHRTDRVNNTTSYGYGKYANAYGEWSYYVANTKYAFPTEKINLLVDYYLDGIYKQMVYGIYTDISVKNRSISQKSRVEPHSVTEIERLLISTDYRKDELEEIIRLRKGEADPSSSFCKFFWQTEHFVCQRPNYYTTVRMFSTRNRNMEKPYNGPGKTTHHRADGTNYLMLRGDEYHNIWPVYDWQKISGTTIMQKPELYGPEDIQKEGLTDFVGAVTDGLYGAVAFDFKSPHDMTEAKKSWFFFDDEYVCLGTGINSEPDLPVVTTINQVLMRSDVSVMQEDKVEKLPHGNRQMDKVKWVYQDKIGYIFPEPTTINLSNRVEQGRWSDITDQKNISEEIVSEEVFTLWFDHGNRPENAAYQSLVVPDVSEMELRQTSSNNRNIDIISNRSEVQAVKHIGLGIYQLAFYKAGEVEISSGCMFSMECQGMAMLKMQGNRIKELTLSDPSRKLGRIMVTVPGIYNNRGDNFVTYPQKGENITVIIADLPEGVYCGKSTTIQLD